MIQGFWISKVFCTFETFLLWMHIAFIMHICECKLESKLLKLYLGITSHKYLSLGYTQYCQEMEEWRKKTWLLEDTWYLKG